MAEFKTDGEDLYIGGKKVLRGWKSFSGWFWFAIEKDRDQLSDFGDGKGVPDTIWFGLVQGIEEEWGYFSQAEIERLGTMAWEIKKGDLPYSGRRQEKISGEER